MARIILRDVRNNLHRAGVAPMHVAAREQSMPNGGKTHIGSGAHGKGAGTGALTDIPKDKVGDNMILSNRDKAQHSDIRGMDGKFIQTEQYQDHSANRLLDDEEADD
jgi:hypothetical protein